jgi:hypothetical protein
MVMKAVRTSETSVNFNVTIRRYIPEDLILAAVRTWNLTRTDLFALQCIALITKTKHHNTWNNSDFSFSSCQMEKLRSSFTCIKKRICVQGQKCSAFIFCSVVLVSFIRRGRENLYLSYTLKVSLTTGWTTGVRFASQERTFLCPDQLWGPSSLLNWVGLPGIKGGRGVTLTTHPIYCWGQQWVSYTSYFPWRLHGGSGTALLYSTPWLP